MPFNSPLQRRIAIPCTAALLIFAAFLCFYKLGHESLQDYDEATYAEITAESVAHGNYLSLTFLNNDYFRKPPLMFWMTIALEKAGIDDELAMRIPSAAAVFLLVPLVVLVCLEAGIAWPPALLAGAVLVTTSAAMEPGRQARFDVLVSFFILLSLYAGMKAGGNRRWYIAMGAAVACAVLIKSVIAVFAPVALLIYLLRKDGISFIRDRWFWGGVGTFMLVAAPWHLYETLRFGGSFWHTYLGTQVIERANSNLFAGTGSPTNADYLGFFFRFAAPWSILFCLGGFATFLFRKYWTPSERALFSASAGTFIAIAGVMLASKTKAVTYLIPIYPFMAIVIALVMAVAWREGNRAARWVLGSILGVLIVMSATHTFHTVFHMNSYYGTQYGIAREERELSKIIVAQSANPTIYTYDNDYLGTVQYYTRLPFTAHDFVYVLESATAIPNDAYVLTMASPEALRARFPRFSFTPLYIGDHTSLYAVSD